MTMTADGPAKQSSRELFGTGTAVVFGVPGAFTPTCNDHHLPGFVLRAAELKAKGVDTIACVSVNDVFVMDAWGRTVDVGEDVVLVADAGAAFAEAMDLSFDAPVFGGTRSRRYAAIVRGGVIDWIQVEKSPGDIEASSAEAVLAAL